MFDKLFKKVVNFAGYGLYKKDTFTLIERESGEWSSEDVRKHGLEAETVLDIGVAKGTPQLYSSFLESYFVMIDPLKESKSYINKYSKKYEFEFIKCALGEEESEGVIRVEKEGIGASSFFERTDKTKRNAVFEERKVDVRKLDNILEEKDYIDFPMGMKIDTEGYELKVLRGAKKALKNTSFIICELSISDRFHGGADLKSVSRFLDDKGFYVADVLGKPGALYLDVLFLKS